MSYVDAIIEKMGGVRAAARALSLPPSTVNSWKARGSIPDQHKERLLLTAHEAGVRIGPEDFFSSDVIARLRGAGSSGPESAREDAA